MHASADNLSTATLRNHSVQTALGGMSKGSSGQTKLHMSDAYAREAGTQAPSMPVDERASAYRAPSASATFSASSGSESPSAKVVRSRAFCVCKCWRCVPSPLRVVFLTVSVCAALLVVVCM